MCEPYYDEEQEINKMCSLEAVKELMEEYLSTYLGPSLDESEKKRILNIVEMECVKPPGMSYEEVKAKLVLNIFQSRLLK